MGDAALRLLDPRRRAAALRRMRGRRLGGFFPTQNSAITAWLRLASATTTGQGYSSVPDVLGATSNAVQTTDAARPVPSTSSNGLPIANFFTGTWLNWPLNAVNNSATKSGFACWAKSYGVGNQNLFVIWAGGGGASANKFDAFFNSMALQGLAEVGGTFNKNPLTTANDWHFFTFEYDGTQGTDAARMVVTVDGVVIATTNTTIPASQPQPTGNAWIGGFGNIQTWLGAIGPNFFWLSRQLTPTERAQLMAFEAPVFLPSELSSVVGWLSLAAGTVTGSGYSSVPDLLATNPAVQTTDADRPPSATSANSLPIMDLDGASDFLSWPAATNNNQTTTSGVGFWFKPDGITGTLGLFSSIPGATNRVEVLQVNNDLVVDVYISQFSTRRGTKSAVFVAGTWYFITWEYNGAGATDADKCTLTINGVVQTLTFSDSSGAPGAMPATLVSSAGPFLIGCRISGSHTGCFDGKFGPNIYTLGSKTTGATQGLLTDGARGSLMRYQQPT